MLEDEKLPRLKVSDLCWCQGNPGAIRVLIDIASTDPMFLNPLGIAMELTNSHGYALWMVYKDRCGYDIEKTKKTLREWFDSSCLPLEQWLDNG